MNIFDEFLMRPIFNLLALLYSLIGDFGIAIIILAVLIRLALWPMIKKQMHQTKLMRSIQPELKKLKKKAKGNRMLEAQLMRELYVEKGIKIGATLWPLVIQLPILIAVFSVIRLFDMNLPPVPESLVKSNDTTCSKSIDDYEGTEQKYCKAFNDRKKREAKLKTFAYPGVADLDRVQTMKNDPENFRPKLFGAVDLTKSGFNYAPAVILAAVASLLQFFQMKQTMPNQGAKRRLRDIMKDAAAGKEPDQSEMMASTMGTMMKIMPIMVFFIAVGFPAALPLYWAAVSGVTVIQQKFLLDKDLDELEEIANEPTKKPAKKSTNSKSKSTKSAREKNAREAEVVTMKPSRNKKSAKAKEPTSGGQTVVRRIKAK
jgi:YidC/Oxa1 family membrane protein insertase